MSDLPPGWARAVVDDVTSEVRSGFASGKHNAIGEGIAHLRPMNVSRLGEIDLTEVKYVDPAADDRRLKPGDILFNNTNSPALVGKTALVRQVSGEHAFSNHMTRLRTVPGVVPAFLAAQLHFLWMAGRLSHLITNHVNQASISSKVLSRQVEVVLPPTAEQERIVATIEEHLSRLDAATGQLRAVSARLAHLAAASTGGLAGDWPLQTLGELTEVVTKGTTPTTLGFDYVTAGVRFVKAESLNGGRIVHDRCAAVDEETHTALLRSQLHMGDLLITIAGTLGRVAEVAESDVPANTNQAVAVVRLTDRSRGGFLRRWLASPAGQRDLLSGGRGVGLQNLNLAQIRSLRVPVPERGEIDAYWHGLRSAHGGHRSPAGSLRDRNTESRPVPTLAPRSSVLRSARATGS